MIIDSPIISGSYSASGSLNQFGDVVISGSLTVTGSIIGTASYSATASYLSGYVSPFPYTGSAIISGSLEVTGSANIPNITGSLSGSLNGTASYAVTASNAVTASYLTGYVSPFPFTGSAIISGSLGVTGSLQVTNLSGSGVRYLVADESGSVTAQSASAALKSTQAFTSTAGQTTFSVTNGYATGYVDVFINGSKLSAAEFTDTSGTNIVLATGSFDGDVVEVVKYTPAAGVTNNVLRQLTSFTATAGQTVFSASYTPGLLDIFYNGSRLSTSDYTANNGTYFTLATASAANDILDVLVYSYQVGAFNGIGGTGVVNQVAFFNTTSSITGSDSFTVSGNTLVGTASYASNADTLDGTHLSTLATTGSNTFTRAQYVSNISIPVGFTDTASIYTDGGIRATKNSYFSSSLYVGGDLIIFGSQSVNYITSSQLNIADNIITVNTSTPAVRFGGIAVQDSGSLASGLTGSLLWDSQNNVWIYTNPSGSSYDGGMVLMGPPNYTSTGNEVGITTNALAKGAGSHHMTSSGIFENGLSASFYNNALVVSSSGNISINSTGSVHKLYVDGDMGQSNGSRIWFRGSTANSSTGSQSWIYSNGLNLQLKGDDNVQILGDQANIITHFDYTGNVGIGTTSPQSILDIRSSNVPRLQLTKTGIISWYLGDTQQDGTNTFSIGTDSGANYRVLNILNTGVVGIGTTNPADILHIRKSSSSNIDVYLDNPDTTAANSARLVFRTTDSGGSTAFNCGGIRSVFNSRSSGNVDNDIIINARGTDNALVVKNSGRVGIGTTSPSSNLGVKAAGADGFVLEPDTNDSTSSCRMFLSSSVQTYGTFNNGGDWRFTYASQPGNTSGTSLARFTNTGKYFRMENGTGGIQFGGNSASTNALNSYEEGTWTPRIYYQNGTNQSNATNITQNGYYTKVGKVVTITCYLVWSVTGALATDNIGIQDLPFQNRNATNNVAICPLIITNVTTVPSTTWIGQLFSNGTTMLFTDGIDTGNSGARVGTGTHAVYATMTYLTN